MVLNTKGCKFSKYSLRQSLYLKQYILILFFFIFAHTMKYKHNKSDNKWVNYRLTHSASELSGFTCTSSLTMNEKFQYRTRRPRAVLKISSPLLVNECR